MDLKFIITTFVSVVSLFTFTSFYVFLAYLLRGTQSTYALHNLELILVQKYFLFLLSLHLKWQSVISCWRMLLEIFLLRFIILNYKIYILESSVWSDAPIFIFLYVFIIMLVPCNILVTKWNCLLVFVKNCYFISHFILEGVTLNKEEFSL